MNINKSILTGRITKDPELQKTTTGKSVVRFNLAVDRGKDKEGNDREATFIPCEVWNTQAENLARYVAKGDKLLIDGSTEVQNYTDSYGNKVKRMFVRANYIEYLAKKQNRQDNNFDDDFLADELNPFKEDLDFSDMDEEYDESEFDLSDGGIGNYAPGFKK